MRNMPDVATAGLVGDVELLRDADARLGRRLAAGRRPNETDRTALRLIAAAPVDAPITPGDLAARLGVSAAAVTSIIRRLTERGHVVISANPGDARSKVLRPSLRDQYAKEDEIARRVAQIEGELDPEEIAVVSRFLRRLTQAIDDLE